MLTRPLALLFVCFLWLGAGGANPAHAQNLERATAKYTMQAMANLDGLIKTENRNGYYFAKNSMVLCGAWMDKSAKYTSLVRFTTEPGKVYVIVAAGDDDARDVDLKVVDRNGNLIKEDDRTDSTARVQFSFPAAREIAVHVRLFGSRDNLPCVIGMAMLER